MWIIGSAGDLCQICSSTRPNCQKGEHEQNLISGSDRKISPNVLISTHAPKFPKIVTFQGQDYTKQTGSLGRT